MSEVEELGHYLPELTSTVAEKNAHLPEEARAREGMKWRSQVEIELMLKIVAAPKVEPAKVKEQEADMRDKLAEVIAIKLIELAKLADIRGKGEDIITASWGGDLMKTALNKCRSPEWRDQQNAASLKATKEATAAVESKDGRCPLVHKVIQYDEKNQPLAEIETIVIEPNEKKRLRRYPGRSGLEPW